jgi:hypothetical protein
VRLAIAHCRTAALGGQVEVCAAWGTEPLSSTSGRTRHCPKCQGSARAKGLDAEPALRLAVPDFQVVFTLPQLLHSLVRVNQRALDTLVFQAATQTLGQFARDPPHRGAELDLPAVLHPWGQTLTEPIHGHGIGTGGGLTAEGTQGCSSHPRCRFAGAALSQVLRGKDRAGLRRLRATPRLHCAGERTGLAAPPAWQTFLGQVQDRAGVVYAHPPRGGWAQELKYLRRYVPRVALCNGRLVFVGDGGVPCRSKDSAAGGLTQIMQVPAAEFLRRFLLPVVPPHCGRIGHCRRLANCTRSEQLRRCRQLLALGAAAATAVLPPQNEAAPGAGAGQAAPTRGPACGGGPLRVIAVLAPHGGHPP